MGDRPFLLKHSPVSRHICCKLARPIGAGVGWFPGFDGCVPLANSLGVLGREARVAGVGGDWQRTGDKMEHRGK